MLKKLVNTLKYLHVPAKVYLALVLFAFIMNFSFMSWSNIFTTALFVLAWTLLIEYAGKKNYISGSWILVFFPFAVLFFAKSIAMNKMLTNLATIMTAQSKSTSSSGTTSSK